MCPTDRPTVDIVSRYPRVVRFCVLSSGRLSIRYGRLSIRWGALGPAAERRWERPPSDRQPTPSSDRQPTRRQNVETDSSGCDFGGFGWFCVVWGGRGSGHFGWILDCRCGCHFQCFTVFRAPPPLTLLNNVVLHGTFPKAANPGPEPWGTFRVVQRCTCYSLRAQ